MSKTVNQADFDAWMQAPWFRAYLSKQIAEADAATRECAATVLVCSRDQMDDKRLLVAGFAARAVAFEDFQDLTYEEVVEAMEDGDEDD